MQKILFFVALAVLTNLHAARAGDGPLTPARDGKIECFSPSSEYKTCVVITRYTWDSSGRILAESDFALNANPLISLKMTSEAFLEEGTLCGVLQQQSLDSMTFFKNGVLMNENEAANFRGPMTSRFANIIGRKICEDHAPYGSLIVTQYTIDGSPKPELTNRLKWISPDEGYVLAP
jgi:hypothetical protein